MCYIIRVLLTNQDVLKEPLFTNQKMRYIIRPFVDQSEDVLHKSYKNDYNFAADGRH